VDKRRIEATLETRRTEGRKALVAYLCVGDPSVDESVDLALEAVQAGADILELGVPFSDPTADGPAIARASQRAIAHGGGLEATLRAAGAVRAKAPDVPVVLFGYYNPIFVRGEERVVDEAKSAGVDGLLVVDLPIEESGPLRAAAAERGMALVPLLAPTSSPERVAAVKAAAHHAPLGFAYYVSVTGVTGTATAPLAEASTKAGRLRQELGLPVVVGFGVASAADARVAGSHADGVVVGTALVKRIESAASPAARARALVALVTDLRSGLDSGN